MQNTQPHVQINEPTIPPGLIRDSIENLPSDQNPLHIMKSKWLKLSLKKTKAQ